MKLQRLVPFACLFVVLAQALPAPVYSSTDSDLTTRDEYDVLEFEARALAPHVAAAIEQYKATTNLPGRHQVFKVPGGPTFTGKDVRKAIFDAHVEHQTNLPTANPPKSNRQLKNSPLKDFGNNDHRLPHPNKPHDTKSINHMKGPGKEFPLGDPKNKGPARVIMQQTKDGHKFMGVVAHDTTRQRPSYGAGDHFQIKPTGPKKKT